MLTDLTNDIATKLEKYEKIREAQRRANKKYRQANPEKFREYSKRYYNKQTKNWKTKGGGGV